MMVLVLLHLFVCFVLHSIHIASTSVLRLLFGALTIFFHLEHALRWSLKCRDTHWELRSFTSCHQWLALFRNVVSVPWILLSIDLLLEFSKLSFDILFLSFCWHEPRFKSKWIVIAIELHHVHHNILLIYVWSFRSSSLHSALRLLVESKCLLWSAELSRISSSKWRLWLEKWPLSTSV